MVRRQIMLLKLGDGQSDIVAQRHQLIVSVRTPAGAIGSGARQRCDRGEQSAERRAQSAKSKARRQRAQFRTCPAARRSSHQRLRLPLQDLGGRTRASVPLPSAAGWSRRSPCSRRAPQTAAPHARSVAPLAPTAPRGSGTAQWQGQSRAREVSACSSTKRDGVIAVVRGWRGGGGGWRVAGRLQRWRERPRAFALRWCARTTHLGCFDHAPEVLHELAYGAGRSARQRGSRQR